jgi:transcription antitermination protein NusB
MSRHAARIAAVEVLYAADVRGVDATALLEDREDADAFCRWLVQSVVQRRDEVDRLIGSHARGWAPERMSVVDRNVLRVGTAELLEGDVPAAAVIDEAVEIAKHFSGAEAGRFVNGVLDAVRQDVAGGAGGGPSSSEPSASVAPGDDLDDGSSSRWSDDGGAGDGGADDS